MTMNSDTTIQECQDAIDDTPDIQYNFVPIAQIANIEANSIIGKRQFLLQFVIFFNTRSVTDRFYFLTFSCEVKV